MHNLTTFRKSPSNIKCLLGLNLKFIPRWRFTTNDLDNTFKRFRQQVYIQDFYQNNPINDCDDNPSSFSLKLHIPTHWIPSIWKVSNSVVNRTNKFFYHIVERLFTKKQCTPNLSTSQLHILKQLWRKDQFIITKADKNLGPCILETETYINYALNDHLWCKNTYKKLSESSATTHMATVRKRIQKFLYQHRKIWWRSTRPPSKIDRWCHVAVVSCTPWVSG